MDAFTTINNLIQNNEFVKAGMLMNCVCSQISIFKRVCDVCAIQHVIQIEEKDLQKMMDEAVDFANNFLSEYGITRKFEKIY